MISFLSFCLHAFAVRASEAGLARNIRFTLLVVLTAVILPPKPARAGDSRPLYLDPTQPVEQRTLDLISRLTLE